MQRLIDYIEQYIALSSQEKEQISHCFKTRKLQNHEIFFNEGDVADEMYFVLS